MNNSLYRLVYISRNQITGDDTTIRQEIGQILKTAQARNPEENITGALMFNAGWFVQVLEGKHDDIQNTFERILCDFRHSQVSVLSFEPATERAFPNWSMAYVGENSVAGEKFHEIAKLSGFDPTKLEGDQIFNLLKTVLLEET